MAFLCPTFQRPERLAELALSWEEHEPGTKLYVRIWEHDPCREEYLSIQWPESWELYVSPAKGAGEALNEFFRLHPNEESYGFIGDDVVLRTTGGVGELERTAGEWFIAYPNDCVQRFLIPTHFCIGGELARTIDCVVPPMFKHNYIDVGLKELGERMNLLRWCPHVIFQHKHFLVKAYGIPKDATYQAVYPTDADHPHGEYEEQGAAAMEVFENLWLPKAGRRLMEKLLNTYELWGEWEGEDVALHCTVFK